MNQIKQLLQHNNLWKEYSKQRTMLLWEDVVGEQIARCSRAYRFAKKTLWVETASPAVAQELSLLSERYREKLNELLADNLVSRIRFVPGNFPRDVSSAQEKPTVTQKDRKRADQLFSELADPRLKRSFKDLYLTLRSRRKALLARGGKRCESCGVVFKGEGDTCPGCRYGDVIR